MQVPLDAVQTLAAIGREARPHPYLLPFMTRRRKVEVMIQQISATNTSTFGSPMYRLLAIQSKQANQPLTHPSTRRPMVFPQRFAA